MLNPDFNVLGRKDGYATQLLHVLQKIGETKRVKQGTVVVDEDVSTNSFFVIIDGIFKTVKEIDGQPYIVCFTFPGDIDGDPLVLMTPPNQYYKIIAVTDSTLVLFNWNDLQREMGEEVFDKMLNHYLLQYIRFLQTRVVESLALSAEERYRSLVKQNAFQTSKIPLLDLAAYLGITPQSLSRIRANRT